VQASDLPVLDFDLLPIWAQIAGPHYRRRHQPARLMRLLRKGQRSTVIVADDFGLDAPTTSGIFTPSTRV
jgi:hypothetical protein